jgi:hypothetical protein
MNTFFHMTAEEEQAIATLRNRGCAVVVWTPPELSDKSPDYMEAFLYGQGFDYITGRIKYPDTTLGAIYMKCHSKGDK